MTEKELIAKGYGINLDHKTFKGIIFDDVGNLISWSYSGIPEPDAAQYSEWIAKIEADKVLQSKLDKKVELKKAFEAEFSTRHFLSSLGFSVDNRRNGIKDDRDNVKVLINQNKPALFKGYDDEFHELTIDQLILLESEMELDGLARYQRLWQLQALVDTIDDLSTITWEEPIEE